MKVLNIHQRTLKQPKAKVAEILATLSTKEDRLWPTEKWPAMRFRGGIRIGAKGGHGPISYVVEAYKPQEVIQFRFLKPKGFDGIHKFEIKELDKEHTEVRHTIDMTTKGTAALMWFFAIRSLHNALLEDALDKLESNFSENNKSTQWNWWVRLIRKQIKR